MRPRIRDFLYVAAVLWIGAAGQAQAQTGVQVTRGQLNCINAISVAQASQCELASACVAQCASLGRTTGDPIGGCYPPYGELGVAAGGRAVDACVAGTRAKVTNTELTKCTAEACPACIGDCVADAPQRTAATAALVDYYIPTVFCDDSLSPDRLSARELRCMRITGLRTGRLARSLVKCYGKCSVRALNGLRPLSSCLPGTTDATTRACLDKFQARAAVSIDRACQDAPECYAPGTGGAFWAQAARDVVDAYQIGPMCAAPTP